MMNSLDLLFIKPNKKELISPIVKIYVKTFTRDKSDEVLITPNCVTLKELEYEIDRLKKELEYIRKKAARVFKSKK